MKAVQIILLSFLASNVNSFTPSTCSSLKIPSSSNLFSTTEEVTTSVTATATTTAPATTRKNEITNNQPKYGNELAFPETYVRCGRCAASFALTEDDLGPGKGR